MTATAAAATATGGDRRREREREGARERPKGGGAHPELVGVVGDGGERPEVDGIGPAERRPGRRRSRTTASAPGVPGSIPCGGEGEEDAAELAVRLRFARGGSEATAASSASRGGDGGAREERRASSIRESREEGERRVREQVGVVAWLLDHQGARRRHGGGMARRPAAWRQWPWRHSGGERRRFSRKTPWPIFK